MVAMMASLDMAFSFCRSELHDRQKYDDDQHDRGELFAHCRHPVRGYQEGRAHRARQNRQIDLRNGLKAARTSCENSFGCSQAA